MRRRSALKLAGGAAAAALLPALPARACQPFPADGEIDFMVLRHGQVIGGHRIRFTRDSGDLVVRSDIEVRLSLLGTTLFRFVHHAEEVWREGWLHAVVSDTDDDGARYRVRAERVDGIFQGKVNGAAFTVSGYIIPASLWHRDTPAVEILFDLVDARPKVIRGRLLGEEEVRSRGRAVTAKHYVLTGQLQRELWYDLDCNLVGAAFPARDGSRITLEPR
jgi:hypothetical protein